MKKIIVIMCIFSAVSIVHAQETFKAQKEVLTTIVVGNQDNQVMYGLSEEGFYSPKGPLVDQMGRLIFIPDTSDKHLQVFWMGVYYNIPVPICFPLNTMLMRRYVSQFGYTSALSGYQIASDGKSFYYYDYYQKTQKYLDYDQAFMAPFGVVFWDKNPERRFIVGIDAKNLSTTFELENGDGMDSWLPKQPGRFYTSGNGLLYGDGILWSPVPLKNEWSSSVYIGKLKSGHNLFAAGWRGQERKLVISNATGMIELVIDIPWAFDPESGSSTADFNMFNYGVGPWGEVYYLIPPVSMWTHTVDEYGGYVHRIKPVDQIADPAELVVVRNHLKYFGRLNDGGVRLRKEPNTTSAIVGTYPVKTGFRILETGTKQETIGGQTAPWYKVRLLDGTEGWFFGAFVANLYDGPGTPPPWPNVADW